MLGGIALAMVRREVAAGATLMARWREGSAGAEAADVERRVEIAALPFAIT
jgi:hypothetical protein